MIDRASMGAKRSLQGFDLTCALLGVRIWITQRSRGMLYGVIEAWAAMHAVIRHCEAGLIKGEHGHKAYERPGYNVGFVCIHCTHCQTRQNDCIACPPLFQFPLNPRVSQE